MRRTITLRKLVATKVENSFHKRPLPKELIALSSPEGKKLFKEALNHNGMESFFPLSEQFITQSEPSYCSLSSLAMVMNALNYDPKRIWKGVWRWVSEEMLRCEAPLVCGHSLDAIKRDGMNFNEFSTLAECHGIKIESYRAGVEGSSLSEFRDIVRRISMSPSAKSFIVVNFSRKFIGQTGDGHFSPIGGIHLDKDLVLILDTARFKYPPFWVPLTAIWDAMSVSDNFTGLPRGYFVLSASPEGVQHKCDVTAAATVVTADHHGCSAASCGSGSSSSRHPHVGTHSCSHHHSHDGGSSSPCSSSCVHHSHEHSQHAE
jgi:glutathione gamma-glutamylcysteinyltransferase